MLYTFADCVLDPQLRTLWRAGQLRHLRPKVFDVLLYLVLHRDRVINKQELCEQVWPEQFISDTTIESTLRAVRQAVGDNGQAQRLIQTFYRHGYRFVAAVDERGEERAETEGMPGQPGAAFPASTDAEARPPEEHGAGPQPPVAVGGTDAERRHLTVLCCDLVDASALTTPRDPETLHAGLHAYHAACTAVVARFEGYVARYLEDGILVYFGFPTAHEDDAQRAVRAGLEIVEAVQHLPDQAVSCQARVGIHTGPVVVGALGVGAGQTPLALGEVPQLAARLLTQAAPWTVVLSEATWRLVAGWFVGEALALQALPGLSQPGTGYRVLRASGAQSRLEVAGAERLTPLVGRTAELALLQERWAQVRDGLGQVVLLSGEAGIGKSRLAETLRAQAASESCPQIVLRCSPYHTHSALFPVLEHLRRVSRIHPEDSPTTKLNKLEQMLEGYRLAPERVVPLLAALLSVPLIERYPPVHLTPERQKQQTYAALVAWLLEEAERQPVLMLCEDLHWADPSTLELLGLCLNQVPTVRLLVLLLFRPEFRLPWPTHAHCTQLTLPRFTRPQVEQMLHYLTRGQPLAAEVLEQVIARTDGVPLFLEEFVKMLQESRLPQEPTNHHERTTPRLPLAIPATLQDALMARLDHLGSTRELALLGATWGREFTYGQLQSLVAMEEVTLQQQLTRLVEAEILYQRGLPPLASYRFKHALIQETAYQSLLRSTRQAYHQRIAQAITEHFPETAETEPELLAHHYTEAGHHAQAIPYWQRAGERALARSANLEAISHLTRGLEVLTTLPDTPERISQELHLQMSLGSVLFSTKGFAAPEVEHAYSRARELCQQVGDTSALFPVLRGLSVWYMNRAQLQPARELAEERLYLAQRQQDPTLILMARATLGTILYHAGEFASALVHIEQSLALPAEGEREYPVGLQYNAVGCLSHVAWALWFLGYADQSRARSQEALELALQLGMPFRLANVFYWATQLHQYRRDSSRTRELAEATLALSTEQGFAQQIGQGRFLRGWALAMQGQAAAGLAQMREGFAAWEATEAEVLRPYYLALLAEVSAYAGETQAGLDLLDAALVAVDKSEERSWEAEVYRLKGELLLQQAGGTGNTLAVTEAAVTCFHQAMTIARRQEAKALELRAAMSLARCCRQEQRAQARALLAEVYNWFTEGFDTVDMQEARALLAALG